MISRAQIKKAILVLRRGGVVIYPTETAYALGADATSGRAVSKVFKLKGRTTAKTLPVIAASKIMAAAYVKNDPTPHRGPFGIGSQLTARYWPGPLSIVAKRRSGRRLATRGIVAQDGTIAIRVSSHPIARALSKGLGRPIISTSANRAGDRACYATKDALDSLRRAPDFVLDAGRLPRRKPSTIVWVADGKIKVLRQGGIYVPSSF